MKKVQLNIKNILSNHLNSYICVHKYRENAYNVIDYCHNSCYLCCVAQCKSDFQKGGKFPNTHIEGNAALRKKGICCAKTQHKRDSLRKNLYDKIKEIEE